MIIILRERKLIKSSKQNNPLQTTPDTFDQAFELHQQRRFQQAEILYQKVLKKQPQHFDALHLLGVLAKQKGQNQRAVDLISRALKINPNIAIAHSNLGVALHDMQLFQKAIASYDNALAINPDNAEALSNRGNALQSLNRYEEALANYDRALIINPNYVDALYNRGNVLQTLKRDDKALASYDRALTIRPDDHGILCNRSNILQSLKRYDEALSSYDRALTIRPDDPAVLCNRGNVLQTLKRYDEALASYDQALVINANYAKALFNRGSVLRFLHRLDEALVSYNRALAIQPDSAEVLYNLGNLFYFEGKIEAAIEYYLKAIALKNDYFEARYALGFLLLSLGKFKEGWQYYEARYNLNIQNKNTIAPNFQFPEWQGESVIGKTLVIWGEQGFGDEIQFCRYVSILKSHGAAYLTWVCKKPLKDLFKTLEAIDDVLSVEDASSIPPHDYWTFALSIPLHCKTTLDNIPATVPYLYAPPEKTTTLTSNLRSLNELKIGICWKGNPNFPNDAERSPGIDYFKPLFKLTGIKFFTLQPDTRDEFLAATDNAGVDFGRELDKSSFEEAAALITNLDLIISCDTSIAHLAGALNKPVWITLPFSADWRWLTNREDNPWYPNTRLFRQSQRGNWSEVIQRVEKRLKKVIAGKSQIIWPIS